MLLRSDRGKINFIALAMLAAVLGTIYALAYYSGPWMRNRTVITALHEASYQAWQFDDEKLRAMIRKKTDPVWVVQEGNEVKPLIDDQTIQITRDGQQIHIDVVYTVMAKLPLTDRWREMTFEDHVTGSLENPRMAREKKKEPGFWSFLGLE